MPMDDKQLRLLAVATYRLLMATTVGNPAPAVAKLYATLTHPRPGDLVMEVTTIYAPREDADRFGRLIMVRDEVRPYPDDETAELNDHEVNRDTTTYIETFGGELRIWHNCEFIRVLEDLRNDEGDESDEQRRAWVDEAVKRHDIVGQD